jgi:glutaredoxin
MKVTIYTVTNCPFSKQEKDYLTSKNLTFEEKNLETNKDFITEMLAVSNNFAGTPVTKIEKDDGQISVIRGFTKEEFDKILSVDQATDKPSDQPTTPTPATPEPTPTPPTPTPTPPQAPQPTPPPVTEPTMPTPTPAPTPPPSETPQTTPATADPLASILSSLQEKAQERTAQPADQTQAPQAPVIPNFPQA